MGKSIDEMDCFIGALLDNKQLNVSCSHTPTLYLLPPCLVFCLVFYFIFIFVFIFIFLSLFLFFVCQPPSPNPRS